MKLPVKTLSCFTFLFLSLNPLTAQLKLLSAANTNIAGDIKKVIEDHPNQFRNIIGDAIIQNPQSVDYRCNLKINGAEECFITKYVSAEKAIYSWQALLLTTESFDEAKKKFRSVYTQLNNLPVHTSQLKAAYESPEEEKRFTNIIFSFSPASEATKKLKVEVLLENEMMEWKVKLLVYEREREDSEQGNVVE